MNGGYQGKDGGALLLLPRKLHGSERGRPAVMARFADSRQARMNPSHHGSDEQVFGAKQQFCTGGKGTKKSICQ